MPQSRPYNLLCTDQRHTGHKEVMRSANSAVPKGQAELPASLNAGIANAPKAGVTDPLIAKWLAQ